MLKREASWRDRAEGLMQAARDIRDEGPPLRRASLGVLGPTEQALFQAYLTALGAARDWAETWWRSVNGTEAGRSPPVEAARRLADAYPLGPSAHPAVIAVLRAYWIACMRLDEARSGGLRLQPEELLLGLLITGGHDELAAFVARLPYWPIGMDAEGNWE